jgi:hypothetical protein
MSKEKTIKKELTINELKELDQRFNKMGAVGGVLAFTLSDNHDVVKKEITKSNNIKNKIYQDFKKGLTEEDSKTHSEYLAEVDKIRNKHCELDEEGNPKTKLVDPQKGTRMYVFKDIEAFIKENEALSKNKKYKEVVDKVSKFEKEIKEVDFVKRKVEFNSFTKKDFEEIKKDKNITKSLKKEDVDFLKYFVIE